MIAARFRVRAQIYFELGHRFLHHCASLFDCRRRLFCNADASRGGSSAGRRGAPFDNGGACRPLCSAPLAQPRTVLYRDVIDVAPRSADPWPSCPLAPAITPAVPAPSSTQKDNLTFASHSAPGSRDCSRHHCYVVLRARPRFRALMVTHASRSHPCATRNGEKTEVPPPVVLGTWPNPGARKSRRWKCFMR